jgi:hypothetical protein
VRTLRRCPKCRSAAIVLVEIATVGIRFEQTVSGRWRRIDEGMTDPEPFMVQGECQDCDHEWRVPGWSMIRVTTEGLESDVLPSGTESTYRADMDRIKDPPVPLRVKP